MRRDAQTRPASPADARAYLAKAREHRIVAIADAVVRSATVR